MPHNILITGEPRIGKSTLLGKLIQEARQKTGMLTEEVMEHGVRIGFDVVTNADVRCPLARVGLESAVRQVSKYGVITAGLESLIPTLECYRQTDLLYLDEIGEMQSSSARFRELALRYLNSTNICIATVSAIHEDPFLHAILKRADVTLIRLTQENREVQLENLRHMLSLSKQFNLLA